MGRGSALVLLAVVGAGAFLSGLELMITAVALPAIVVDLADWTALRAASWIINGYLLVSIVVMPLAGQLADRHGVPRVFLWALVIFITGSILAGRAGNLTELITARLVQAIGGGALVPVATAAASHLFGDRSRPRALGAVGALTFLGMAAGPFAGSWIMQAIHPIGTLDSLGVTGGLRDALASPWRYVFYLNVPLGLATLALGWAAMCGWTTPRREHRLDLPAPQPHRSGSRAAPRDHPRRQRADPGHRRGAIDPGRRARDRSPPSRSSPRCDRAPPPEPFIDTAWFRSPRSPRPR
jgi:MFS family permease